ILLRPDDEVLRPPLELPYGPLENAMKRQAATANTSFKRSSLGRMRSSEIALRVSSILEVQDKPIPENFRLPTLEAYDNSSNPTEHIVALRAQMVLYEISNA
ncbi:hypothetical protein BHM03_00031670, partial [Ensete ventricosum]